MEFATLGKYKQELFEEYRYLSYKFPEPQYLGSKFIHRDWIAQYVPDDAQIVLDAFAGSQSISFLMKQMGKKTICNDFMAFNHQIGKALIENRSCVLDSSEVDYLFSPCAEHEKKGYNLIENLYSDLFFVRDEARVIDSFRCRVDKLENEYKRALALAVMCRSLTRKVTMGHFAHTQALKYASNPERIKRNRSLIRPIEYIFRDVVCNYNSAVFFNGQENLSYNENILDLLPKLGNIDFIYIDPPYCDSHADYQSFYHLLETFVMYWKDKNFVNSIKRYDPKRYSGFDKKQFYVNNLRKLFNLADRIPYWLISYNDRSFPDVVTMMDLTKTYRNVRLVNREYHSSRGGKGSVAGSNEILLICSPK